MEGCLMGFLSSITGGLSDALFGTGDAIDAQREAAQVNQEYLDKSLDYQKEVQQPVLDLRNQALPQLYGFYDPTNSQGQQQFIDQAQSSPFYKSMINQGEEAVARNAAATGNLRSGSANLALAQNSQNVLQNLVNQNLSGLSSFAQTPINTSGISNTYQNMGTNAGNSLIQQAQTRQDGLGQLLDLGISAASMASDPRLKVNVQHTGEQNGYPTYTWEWNDKAAELGLSGKAYGTMSTDVSRVNPDAVITKNGYDTVDYSAIGVDFGTIEE